MACATHSDKSYCNVTTWDQEDGYAGELTVTCQAYVKPLDGENRAQTLMRLQFELDRQFFTLREM